MSGETTEEWVSSNEGAEILGLEQNHFLYYVKNGDIESRAGTRQRDRRYKLSDILKVRKKLIQKERAKRKAPAPVLFDIIRREDLPACLRLDQIVYPDDLELGELATYQSWRQKNQRVSIAAYDASNRDIMLAYIALLPLPEAIILDILRGKRADHSVTVDEVESYDRPGPYTLLALSAVCHPDRPELLYKLMRHIMDYWLEQFPDRYVTRIYAQAVSESGDRLISHLFMSPRYDLAHNAYMLDLARPGASKVVRKFQAQIRAKAPLPAELQPDFSLPVTQLE